MCREPDQVNFQPCEAGRLLAPPRPGGTGARAREEPDRPAATRPSPNEASEEELVPDLRAALRPALAVQQKLIGMLKGDTLLVSHTVVAHHGTHVRRPPHRAAR